MLKQLTLTNFRNHETLRIKTASHNIILTGNNGAGKTNVLEAISLLNGGTGIRRAQALDIAKSGMESYAVAAELKDDSEISVYWQGQGHRKAKINGEAASLSELSKLIRIIWMTPAEDMLLVASPSDRRAFLDNLIAGYDASHFGRTARLAKLMSERAFALKNGADTVWLSEIEKNIVMTASAVADARVRYAAAINHFFTSGKIALSGFLEQRIINGEKAGDFEDFYQKYLAENRYLISDKMTIDGPHRSDFSILNTELNRQADKTSSGQQKLLLHKLIAADANLLNATDSTKPLLILLDEADGHLDANAKSELFDNLSKANAQIWMTGIDQSSFSALPDADIVRL